MRKILLCTLGATPQIVTETADVLMTESDGRWRPEIVEIVTTAPGLKAITNGLFGPMLPWETLFGDTPPSLAIHCPVRPGLEGPSTLLAWRDRQTLCDVSQLMEDVTTTSDAERMADAIKDRLWHWIKQPDTELHVSIAGGRKTMSAHALIALALLGRAQDEASHILVEKEYESYRGFWHRKQGGCVHSPEQIRAMRPGSEPGPPERNASTVELNLMRVPIPFIAELRETDRSAFGEMRFGVLLKQIALANRFRAAPRFVLNPGSNTVSICDEETRLPPVEFAKLWLLSEAVRNGWATEARSLPKFKTCIAADGGVVFFPVEVLLGLTARRNRVAEVWIPRLAKAQTAAGREEDVAPVVRHGEGNVSPKKTAMQRLEELSTLTDKALARLSAGFSGDDKAVKEALAAATTQLASFTELRGIIGSHFGGFVANQLLQQGGPRPKLARFRLNCPREAIQLMAG